MNCAIPRTLVVLSILLLAFSLAYSGPPPDPTGDIYDQGNTANGPGALFGNTTGSYNNATGTDNTASGAFALQANTTGSSNTATGAQALEFNTTGGNNTASGVQALS